MHDPPENLPMQLEATLALFPLREVLELALQNLFAGAVEIEAPDGWHRVYLRDGRLYHAESSKESGFDALWPLFELSDAPFRLVVGITSSETTIVERPAALLMRAERLAAEWKSIRPVIAHLDVVPELAAPGQPRPVTINHEHWAIVALIDGARTIREILTEELLDHLWACKVLLRLHRLGLVHMQDSLRSGAYAQRGALALAG